MNTFKVNINALKQHKPEHISLHTNERQNTKLSKNIENGLISLPSDSNIEYYWRKYMKFLKQRIITTMKFQTSLKKDTYVSIIFTIG